MCCLISKGMSLQMIGLTKENVLLVNSFFRFVTVSCTVDQRSAMFLSADSEPAMTLDEQVGRSSKLHRLLRRFCISSDKLLATSITI